MNPAGGAIAPAPGDRLAAEPRLVGRPTVRLIGPIAVLSLASAVGTAGAPWLRGTPLLLMALAPRLPFLAFAAQRVGFLPFLVVGTVRLCLADPFHFRIGRRVGRRRHPGRPGRPGRLRLTRRASAVAVLIRPNGRHLALAGAAGLRVAVVVILDLAGTVLYLACLHAGSSVLR